MAATIGQPVRVHDPEANKANAIAFYDLMLNECQPAEAMSRYAGAEYGQHNPGVGDGKNAFIDYFERMATKYPGKRAGFKRAIAEGDMVCTASSTGPVTTTMPGSILPIR